MPSATDFFQKQQPQQRPSVIYPGAPSSQSPQAQPPQSPSPPKAPQPPQFPQSQQAFEPGQIKTNTF